MNPANVKTFALSNFLNLRISCFYLSFQIVDQDSLGFMLLARQKRQSLVAICPTSSPQTKDTQIIIEE